MKLGKYNENFDQWILMSWYFYISSHSAEYAPMRHQLFMG